MVASDERGATVTSAQRDTPLAEVVAASEAIGATRSRREKIRLLAGVLGRLAAHETEAGIALLAGAPRQDRLGLGPAAVADRAVEPADTPQLTVSAVDVALQDIEDTPAGSGSRRARIAARPRSGG